MEIKENCIVRIHYTLTDESGATLDQSSDGEPLVYLHGSAGIVPALEAELTGKTAGDSFDVTITPDGGFGERLSELFQEVPRTSVPDDIELQVGIQVEARGGAGGDQIGVVTAFTHDSVTLDFNHPLAGLTLCFKGSVDGVREASEEEIQHWPNPVGADESDA
jgi:FKBP-type peptidyl-prolyl cis-trans isomerase SlyD